MLYLIRHAEAQTAGFDSDESRALTANGERQANALVTALAGSRLALVLSSPTKRCRQTVAPMAKYLNVTVQMNDALRMGSDPISAWQLLVEQSRTYGEVAACTHADIVEGILGFLRESVEIIPFAFANGCIWSFGLEGEAVSFARYLVPEAG